MKVPKIALLLTLTLLFAGVVASSNALASTVPSVSYNAVIETVPATPDLKPAYFDPNVTDYDLNIYYVGETSIEGYGDINVSTTFNGMNVYDYVSEFDLTSLILKANFSGKGSVDVQIDPENRSTFSTTGQVYVLYNGLVNMVQSSASVEDAGIAVHLPQGDTVVTLLYINFKQDGTFEIASDSVMIRISKTNYFPSTVTTETYSLDFSFTDTFDPAVPLDFNNTGLGGNYAPEGDVNMTRGTEDISNGTIIYVQPEAARKASYDDFSLSVAVNTGGSNKTIDDILENGTVVDYSEQDVYYDGAFANVSYNIFDGDTGIPGLAMFYDGLGLHPITDVTSFSVSNRATQAAVGVVTFTPLGFVLDGWEVGVNWNLGGDYSANVGVGFQGVVLDFERDGALLGYSIDKFEAKSFDFDTKKVTLSWEYSYTAPSGGWTYAESIDALAGFILLRSTDDGATWEEVKTDIAKDAREFVDAVSSLQEGGVINATYKLLGDLTGGLFVESGLFKFSVEISTQEGTPVDGVAIFFALLVAVPVIRKLRK